jgi:predicted AAA+ superfamily ATPase
VILFFSIADYGILQYKNDICRTDEIYRSILEKDIAYLLKLEKPEVFSALIKILAGQIGQLMNYTELESTLNVSFATVKKYLW